MHWSQKTLNNNSNFIQKEDLLQRKANGMQKKKKQKQKNKKGVAVVVVAITEYGFSATNKATVKIVPP